MNQYQELLKDILNKGTWKDPARANMPKTISLFGTRMEFDMKEGFPLLTTKKMYTKGIVTELLWFLKGDTNIKYLVDNGCNIWNQDAYRWYLKNAKDRGFESTYTLEEFIEAVKNSDYSIKDGQNVNDWVNGHWDSQYKLGDLGKVYGEQWRNQNGVDQLKTCIERIKSDPMGRYAIIDAWNPSDFNEMALPPCHLLYQFNCRALTHEEKIDWVLKNTDVELENLYIYEETFKESTPKYYLDLQMYQRSCDTFLGVPFNIASAALLLHLVAKVTNTVPSKFVWVGGDTHIYENHLEQVNEQLSRDPLDLCTLDIKTKINSIENLEKLTADDIAFVNYDSFPPIKGELKTGL